MDDLSLISSGKNVLNLYVRQRVPIVAWLGLTHTALWPSFQMTFHTGYCETVLFDSWKVSSIGGLLGSMIGIFIMAALYEGLKYYRYHMWLLSAKPSGKCCCDKQEMLTFCIMHASSKHLREQIMPGTRLNEDYCFREYLFWKTYSSLQYRAVSMPAEKRIMEEDNRIVQ